MNDPQEKHPKSLSYLLRYHSILMPVLNARSDQPWNRQPGVRDSFRCIFDFIPASETHDLTDKQD